MSDSVPLIDPLDAFLYPGKVNSWRELQSQLVDEKKRSLIAFQPDNDEEDGWHWLLDFTSYNSPLSRHERKATASPNEELRLVFSSKVSRKLSFWMKLEQQLKGKGFFLPVEDIKRYSTNFLSEQIHFLEFRQKYFPWGSLLRKISEDLVNPKLQHVRMPVISLWRCLSLEVLFFKKVIQLEETENQLLTKHYSAKKWLSGFNKKLPSDQLLSLLHCGLACHYIQEITPQRFDILLQNSAPTVQGFWTKYGRSLSHYFQHGFDENMLSKKEEKRNFTDKEHTLYSELDIRRNFYHIFLIDFAKVKIQEVLDEASGEDFLSFLPEEHRSDYGLDTSLSLAQKMKEAVANSSIIDRIQTIAENRQGVKHIDWTPLAEDWLEGHRPQWAKISEQQNLSFLTELEEHLPRKKKDLLQQLAGVRWYRFLLHHLHQFTSPFIRWKIQDGLCFPQWNVLDDEKSRFLLQQFAERTQREEEEKKHLNQLLIHLYTLQSIEEINDFAERVVPFTFPRLQKRWQDAIHNHILAQKNRYSYRSSRMMEFGILKDPADASPEMEVWLDEMLKIEKEVSPYIGFVKKVFQSALPNRKTTEFDPYRHSHDGVEFDPETIQDQNKWVTGEVMKTLRHRVEHGEVAQINVFCLDASGSMRHLRMRNLFKMLYLLVLGLEDRKSYDAFHFFSTEFMPGAEFSSDYTNRSVLFDVLQKISQVDGEKVRYFGIGGTNLWQGISRCHERIVEFSEILEKEIPGISHVKSIFVITDGEPSVGLVNKVALHDGIQKKRDKDGVAIKGIYIKPEDYDYSFMEKIFGTDNFVETHDFNEAISELVYIMSHTYKKQRADFKEQKRRKKMEGKQ